MADRRDKCKAFGMLWIIVGFRILDIMAIPLLGVTGDLVIIMFGLGWIKEWL